MRLLPIFLAFILSLFILPLRSQPVRVGATASATASAFPEFPVDAAVTEGIHTYSSTIDTDLTTLKARYYYPTGATNLPCLLVIHGYEQTAVDLGEDNLRRFARYGYFVIAVEMRGSTGSGGNPGSRDAGGRQTYDIYDAYISCKATFSEINADRVSIVGFSGGGGCALSFAARFPDLAQVCVDYFGISDYGYDATFGWYNQAPARQVTLQNYVGGTPLTKPDEYLARYAKNAIARNFQGYLYMFHSTGDGSVDVTQSQRVEAEYIARGRSDYFYSEDDKWVHGYPSGSNDLEDAEVFWKSKPKTQPIVSVPTTGTMKVNSLLKTKRFTVWLNDGNYLNAGRSRVADLNYDTDANEYTITPTIDETTNGYLVATVYVEDTGYVGVAVINDGVATTIEPSSIVVDGNTPIMWFDAAVGVLNDGSGNAKVWADKTGGPLRQGYALRLPASGSNLPAILSSDINSLPAIEFVTANTEGLEGERRRDWQGISGYTLTTVTTGAYIGQASGANSHQQQAISGASYFLVNANGGAGFGSYAGTAVYLVRSTIFDGSQPDNATRLVGRENKVAKTLSFTGTIQATTENTAAIFRMGRRAYDPTHLGGKIAEVLLFATPLADVGDKEDILKSKYGL